MYFLRDWFEAEKSKHDISWADNMIRNIRLYMTPLISADEAQTGMDYLLGRQSLDYVQNLFQNTTKINLTNENRQFNHLGNAVNRHEGHDKFMQTEMTGACFRPLPLLEKMRITLTAEMKKMGVVVNVRSNDPTSSEDRNRDKALLTNKKKIETDLSHLYTKLGQRPVKMEHLESRFGENPAAGNIEAYKEMGLDDGDPQDINQFMEYFHKLGQEMAAQEVIDYCMLDNEVMDKIEMWVTDIMAKKAICAACHVSDVNGKITYDYMAPETVWIYGGSRRKDYNDANAKAYQQKVSIKEMLDRFGNSFDFQSDWDNLLMAITFAGTSIEYTGIFPSWQGLVSGEQWTDRNGSNFGINNFLAFKVTIGYIEWSAQIQEEFGNTRKATGNQMYEDNQTPDGERYQTKARYETPTYKSFYLVVSSVTQVLFNFGKMTYQQIEGYNDFNTNFSIITWKEIGDPLAIMARQFIDIIHEAWFKFKYEIRRAKPAGVSYNYESLLSIAEDVFMDVEIDRGAKLQKILSFMDSSANNMWSFPRDENGKMITTGINNLHVAQPNGLSPDAMKYSEIIITQMDLMQDVLAGKAPLRQGDPGGSRDSMNNQFKALEYSQNATAYIPDMLTFMFQQCAQKTMLFTQDIVQYKKYNTLAYKYLIHAVGEDALEKINGLGKRAMHRYGIFVESLNQTVQRAKLSQRIDFALQNKLITNAQALLVEDIKSPMKAFLWLAYFEEKTDRNKQKQAMEMQKAQQDGLMQIEAMRQKTEQLKIDGTLQNTSLEGKFNLQQHANTANAQITKQEMKSVSDAESIYHQLRADMIHMLAEQGKIPPVMPMGAPGPAMPTGGPSPQTAAPVSAIGQEMIAAQPTATSAAPQLAA